MKKLLIALALFMTCSIAAQAQTAMPPHTKQVVAKNTVKQPLKPAQERAVPYTNELKKKLDLTNDQYQQILGINRQCIERKDALKANGNKDKGELKSISTFRKEQYASILTPAQMKKLNEINSKNKSAGE